MFSVNIFLVFETLNQNFYGFYNNLYNCDMSLLTVLGTPVDHIDYVECYDAETDKWEQVARMGVLVDEVIVSYEPCVPNICKNFPF